MAPIKETRIKNNSQDWFDNEIAEKIKLRNKLFKKFKTSKNNIDETLYKSARQQVQIFIKNKKRDYYQNKLSENIGKPKEL